MESYTEQTNGASRLAEDAEIPVETAAAIIELCRAEIEADDDGQVSE